MNKDLYKIFFPFPTMRPQQEQALEFVLDNINKYRFICLEITTGGGKSGIAITLAKWIEKNYPSSGQPGAYLVTTQKILQQQYVDDFPFLANIWSKSNYQCQHRKKASCEEGLFLATTFPESEESQHCLESCIYKEAKDAFLNGPASLTNISFMLHEVEYNKKMPTRQLLVVDECHNLEQAIVDFVAIKIDRGHCEKELGIKYFFSATNDMVETRNWVETKYYPVLSAKVKEITEEIGVKKEKSKEARGLIKSLFSFQQKLSAVERLLDKFDPLDWVSNHDLDFFEIKPLYASRFAERCLFSKGDKVLLMSGTILDKDTFCRNIGIRPEEACFLSLPSPFPVENRSVFVLPVGSMSYKNIQVTLPDMSAKVQSIIKENHPDDKGIIHTHNYNIARYLKENDATKRMLLHDSQNRMEIYQSHLNTTKNTVLVSPSFTEGIDLVNDFSRFQIVCKMPYPYLKDNYILTKMKRCKSWYEWMTTKTLIQGLGRSIRSEQDYAISYILDADFNYFYKKNAFLFPDWFKESLVFIV